MGTSPPINFLLAAYIQCVRCGRAIDFSYEHGLCSVCTLAGVSLGYVPCEGFAIRHWPDVFSIKAAKASV